MLEVENLYKYYGSFAALDGLSLSIKKGELFGFVGPMRSAESGQGPGPCGRDRCLKGLPSPEG